MTVIEMVQEVLVGRRLVRVVDDQVEAAFAITAPKYFPSRLLLPSCFSVGTVAWQRSASVLRLMVFPEAIRTPKGLSAVWALPKLEPFAYLQDMSFHILVVFELFPTSVTGTSFY